MDFFFKSNQNYEVYSYNGQDYKVATPWEAIKEKISYIEESVKGSKLYAKHVSDLAEIFANLKK